MSSSPISVDVDMNISWDDYIPMWAKETFNNCTETNYKTSISSLDEVINWWKVHPKLSKTKTYLAYVELRRRILEKFEPATEVTDPT